MFQFYKSYESWGTKDVKEIASPPWHVSIKYLHDHKWADIVCRQWSQKYIIHVLYKDKYTRGVDISVDDGNWVHIYFHDRKEFLKHFASFLDHQIGTVKQERRPFLWWQWKEIYEKLNLRMYTGDNKADIFHTSLEYQGNSVYFHLTNWWSPLVFEKKSSNKVDITYQNKNTVIHFINKKDFLVKITNLLNTRIGTVTSGARKNVLGEMQEIYAFLSTNEKIPVWLEKTLFWLPLGQYTISKKPLATYLLVRNKNRSKYYCLALVQEMYSLLYGGNASREDGLFSAKWAANISLPYQERYNSVLHDKNTLPLWTILRLSSDEKWTFCGSIGIYLWNGKVAHLIGGTLHVESLSKRLSDGWYITYIAKPHGRERKDSTHFSSERFKKHLNLETLWWRLKKKLKLSYNQALIDEIIFQLNRDAFEIYSGGWGDTILRLKDNTKIKLPVSRWW